MTKFLPMLAQGYTDDVRLPAFTQPKLDGIRCIANADGLWTRNGNRIVMPHIEEALRPLFAADPSAILDGELYSHDLKNAFQRICSIVRKRNPSAAEIEESRILEFHAFDMPSANGTFGARFDALELALRVCDSDAILLVETRWVEALDDLDGAYFYWFVEGYEGQMIRTDDLYVQGRTRALLKRKVFQTAEFEILRIIEGNRDWSGCAKSITVRTTDGLEFHAALHMPHEMSVSILENAHKYIGKMATVQFHGYTDRGVPRFPTAIDIDRDDIDVRTNGIGVDRIRNARTGGIGFSLSINLAA